jgi:hypothetical protein
MFARWAVAKPVTGWSAFALEQTARKHRWLVPALLVAIVALWVTGLVLGWWAS